MALKDGSRIKQTTTSTGFNNLVLNAPAVGYTSFLSEIGSGNSAFYWLFDGDGFAWEMGVGVMGSDGTFIRNAIRSSANNALIELTAATHTIINAPVNGFATGDMNFQDLLLQRPEIRDYSETVATPTILNGTLTLNLETANVFNVVHNANIATLDILNPPISGKCGSFTLHLTQDATGGRTLTFPSSVKWAGGTAPTLNTAANKRNKFVFDTLNSGVTIDCAYCGAF